MQFTFLIENLQSQRMNVIGLTTHREIFMGPVLKTNM